MQQALSMNSGQLAWDDGERYMCVCCSEGCQLLWTSEWVRRQRQWLRQRVSVGPTDVAHR